ncbi:MAG TPA: hypothetical protein VFD48_17610 [Pyrinomonadaceae bacterium]|nr:hypothetical protein [Pyrinomonadaceae bacterium]
MNCTQLTATFILGIVLLTQTLPERGWQNIVPLQSTRKDVERLLGAPQESRGVTATYQLKEGRLRVFYSDGSCKQSGTNDWNVAPDTVVTLTFQPSKKMMITELNLDMTKYERDVDYHLTSAVHYYNRQAGIRISTRLEKEGEDVHIITYEPKEKDLHLRCGNRSQAPEKDFYPGLAFDQYGRLSFKREKPHLDNFAGFLQKNEPTLLGYIIVYRARGMRTVDAELRAKRAKDYMVKARGLDAKRIVPIMAGCREELEIVLYAIPDSMAPPIISKPDCDN